MLRYRNKPIKFDAIQFRGGCEGRDEVLAWMADLGADVASNFLNETTGLLRIGVGDGTRLSVWPAHWVIRCWVTTGFITCHPVIFAENYESFAAKETVEQDAPLEVHFRALIKPIVLEMHRRNLSRLLIKKDGTKVQLNAE